VRACAAYPSARLSAMPPRARSYDAFISAHGGSANAFTACEHTCFELEINPRFLAGALDRLASFVAAPLWRADAADRELHAIESEFEQARGTRQRARRRRRRGGGVV
jgi:secreted Zn-dependent insulinase-like peptidase